VLKAICEIREKILKDLFAALIFLRRIYPAQRPLSTRFEASLWWCTAKINRRFGASLIII